MPLPSPNLDDRDFAQLVDEAVARVRQTCPAWTDLSAGDPGMVLLELFAHLTEIMIYRLNRLPEKAYYEFLNLMGVRLHPPCAGVVTLRFSRSAPGQEPIEIPAGTRVSVGRSDGAEVPVFATARAAALDPDQATVDVTAYHCDLVEGELAGLGTGLAGLSLNLRQPPVIAPTGDELDLVVGVEAGRAELGEGVPAREYGGKNYRLWRAVDSFSAPGPDAFVYVADRYSGQIAFAPATRLAIVDGKLEDVPRALGQIPAAGREIRAWYRRGGGAAGNVAAGTLTVLKDPIPGVDVTNPAPAVGGRPVESVENALVRGPQELRDGLERAITARDFEACALRASGTVARARAVTQRAIWAHAAPGAVEILLVPYLPEEQRGTGQVTVAALQAQRSEAGRQQIIRDLETRRPLGVNCVVTWAQIKPVSVRARVVVRRQENREAVERRVLARLYGSISPLPTAFSPTGWQFGQPLHASHVWAAVLAEPGVLWVDGVRLRVEEVPDRLATALAVDYYQPKTWYAASGATLFRSLDNGEGWEPVRGFPGESVQLVRAHNAQAGLVAVGTQTDDQRESRLYVSRDCGESWDETPVTMATEVNGLDWTVREGVPVLLLATDAGLYELALARNSSPVQVLVDPTNQALAFYAVAVAHEVRGQVSVALAAQEMGGVFLSHQGGQSGTFRHIGLQGEDIRVLAVQYDKVQSFLWAGAYASSPDDPGEGCQRRELLGSQDSPEGWRLPGPGWKGGNCLALAFLGTQALAASHQSGVLRLDIADRDPKWVAPDVNCGLPLLDPGRFQPVATVSVLEKTVMAGTEEKGVFRSQDGGTTYVPASAQEFADKVTLPPTWLFCSGTHTIDVVSEDEVVGENETA